MTFQLYNFTFSLCLLLQTWFTCKKFRHFWKAVCVSWSIHKKWKKGSKPLGKKWVHRWEEVPHTCIVSLPATEELPASQPWVLHSQTLHRNWRAASRTLLSQTDIHINWTMFMIFGWISQLYSTLPIYFTLWAVFTIHTFNKTHLLQAMEHPPPCSCFREFRLHIFNEVAAQKNSRR